MDTTTIICGNWRFHLGECEEAWYRGYGDGGWKEVAVPHDWSVEQPFSKEYSSGTGYVCGGIGWYRAHFTLPEEYRGKYVRVVFDGVYKNSQVWCNSTYLGKRPSGYTTFSYDITPFLYFGGEDNVISVKVTHTDLADSRWFTGSGITRKVALKIEEPVHPEEYGTVFQTLSAGEHQAGIRVEHRAVNESGKEAQVEVRTVLLDRSGRCAWERTAQETIGAGEKGQLVMDGTIADPDLWSVEDPALYRMQTYYCVDGGAEYLAHEEPVGIRTFRFDPDRGFFLNDREMKIKGVCVHHDGGCLGAAMRREVWERRLERLKGCGCNAIRCSHNPHMPELYGLCDEMGFLMMDEAFDEWENAKNKWSTGHNVYPPKHQGYFEDFPQWHDADLRAMVRRDRNHPSVVMWSIGNEIDYPNDPYCHPMFQTMTGNNDANKPEAERRYDPNRPNAERLPVLAAKLASIVREEDPTRPVTLAAAFPELSSRLGFLSCLDVVGYNYKEHLYEEDHVRFPDKPFIGSENGHGYGAWLAVRDNPYISGQFLWTGIDYLGETKGWPERGSRAGLLTCGGFEKAEYYRRMSFWQEEPMIHMGTHREGDEGWMASLESWNYRPGDKVTVHCYSNLPQVKLFLNNAEVGCLTERAKDGSYCFHGVPYEKGTLRAVGYGPDQRPRAEYILETAGPAAGVSCSLWSGIAGASASGREAGFLHQLEIELRDGQGRKAVWDDRAVEVLVDGPGILAGLENGNLADTVPYFEPARSTYHGELIAYIRRLGPGTITVTVKPDIPGCREQTAVIGP